MEVHGGPNKRRKRKPVDPKWLAFISDNEKEADRVKHWQSTSLAEVGLSVRIVNALENHGIMTLGELAERTVEELRAIQNLGEITICKCSKLLTDLELPHKLNQP